MKRIVVKVGSKLGRKIAQLSPGTALTGGQIDILKPLPDVGRTGRRPCSDPCGRYACPQACGFHGVCELNNGPVVSSHVWRIAFLVL